MLFSALRAVGAERGQGESTGGSGTSFPTTALDKFTRGDFYNPMD